MQIRNSALRFVVCLCAVILIAGSASANTVTVATTPSGTGTITYTVTANPSSCVILGHTYKFTRYYINGFSYTNAAGANYPFGFAFYDVVGAPVHVGCPANGDSLGATIIYVAYYMLKMTPSGAGAIGNVTTGVTGYVDPKYLVVGVTYAPPDPSPNTFVQYQNSAFVGSTQSLSNSFSSTVTTSLSGAFGRNIPMVVNGKITTTDDTTNTQTSKNTSTFTTSIQVQQGEKTFGTADYFAPVDNDYDTIWVWLNPVVISTVFSGTNHVTWNGYGFDGTDESAMDIVGIPLGYLNGDLGVIPPDIQTRINRSWAASQLPTGQDPALNVTDFAQIASADPFSVSTYGPNYLGYNPPSVQTSDGRFAVSACNPTPGTGSGSSFFNYIQANPSQQPGIYTCQLTYTNTTTQAQQLTYTFSETYTVDESIADFLTLFSTDTKNSNTLSWTTDWQNSITTSTTSTANLSVQGPPCNNAVPGVGPCIPVYDTSGNQPTQFDVYEDTIYGTFMFAPVHYY